jgi:hypothetical protein
MTRAGVVERAAGGEGFRSQPVGLTIPLTINDGVKSLAQTGTHALDMCTAGEAAVSRDGQLLALTFTSFSCTGLVLDTFGDVEDSFLQSCREIAWCAFSTITFGIVKSISDTKHAL